MRQAQLYPPYPRSRLGKQQKIASATQFGTETAPYLPLVRLTPAVRYDGTYRGRSSAWLRSGPGAAPFPWPRFGADSGAGRGPQESQPE